MDACVDDSRRRQLTPYVAPPVGSRDGLVVGSPADCTGTVARPLLYLASPDGPTVTRFDLSKPNTARPAGVMDTVLALTVAVTVTVAIRLVRPLRALTAARPSGEEYAQPTRRHDRSHWGAPGFRTGTQRAAVNYSAVNVYSR
ncbi:hypothetical protein ACWDG1_41225 [Streptomyces sp. NPDC001177]